MTLVRVYCGLASAEGAARLATAEVMLVAAVVDDAGRLLDVREISDAPNGYARLAAMLVERSSGPSGAAVAADSEDHLVTSLLTAAGSPLAIVDEDAVEDYAERFADEASMEELHSPAAVRRAVGLARALQAGAICAVTLPTPRELVDYKPVLAAHAALAHGRQAAAVALREVLRELYPAALRAYPDPAEPLSLAVLDALPEPGMLSGRGRNPTPEPNAVVAHLVSAGIADEETVKAAVTALRVAGSETARRSPTIRVVTSAVAEAVRQAVAAVRACDAGCEMLAATLAHRRVRPTPEATRPAQPRAEASASGPVPANRQPMHAPDAEPAPARRAVPDPAPARRAVADPAVGRRARSQPAALNSSPTAPRPVTPPPVAPPPLHAPAPRTPDPAVAELTAPGRGPTYHAEPAARPVSAPPPPPGISPIVPTQRAPRDDLAETTPTLAAAFGARGERQWPTPISPRPRATAEPPPSEGFSATDNRAPLPTPFPAAEPPPPGSRANWPLVSSSSDRDSGSRYPYRDSIGPGLDLPGEPPADSRVTPPWLADDLPPEPPMLRLVEPAPLADRALRGDRMDRLDEITAESRPLRLVDADGALGPPGVSSPDISPRSAPPVPDEGDGDLLIFAQIRSAWFTGQPEESDVGWGSFADSGWRAAEHAAEPEVGDETDAGLPRRVPQANLVPGSPPREDRPLRIVRDPESIAAHTTGYFRGYRRGQEIGGYAVGGRPGRQAAGGWDFTREQSDGEDSDDYQYRSAGHRF